MKWRIHPMGGGGENLCKWLDGCASMQWTISWGVVIDGQQKIQTS